MESRNIGGKIAEARKKMNLSQAQLAQQLFISAQAVGKWERGESLPDIIMINRMAKILNVDLNYFSQDFKPAEKENVIQNQTVAKAVKKLSRDMSLGNWANADFSGLKDLHEKFSSSNMQNCRFNGSDLSGLQLKSNNIGKCDFSDSDFSRSHIHRSFLSKNLFKNCSLQETEFSESFLRDCDLTGADLSGVVFSSGGFEKNIIENAVLNRISFLNAYVAEITFSGKIIDCSFENCSFKKVTFNNAIFVNCFFKCKSLKRIKFIDCRADRLSYEFLKNGKADMSGVALVK